MVLPKSTVHVSRIAGTALKSFTHGYAQTVVAASQSSYASQNTPVAPLASNWLSRLNNKSGKSSDRHAHFGTSAASQATTDAAKHDAGHDLSLSHYQDAWHKHHKTEVKDRQSLQLAKRIGWKPPTTIPDPQHVTHVADAETHPAPSSQRPEASGLKRSYSTSAVNDFTKAIDNEEAEALAIAQVNESISVARTHRDVSPSGLGASGGARPATPQLVSPVAEVYSAQLQQLVRDRQFARIPSVFESMLRDGVAQPSQEAYRALLVSAVELTESKHQKAPRVLDIYADMMRRRVVPDADTTSCIVDTLAARALDAAETSARLLEKQTRLGSAASVFALDQLEYQIMAEDQTLAIALRFIATSPVHLELSATAYEHLIKACAKRGQTPDMITLYNSLKSSRLVISTSIFPVMIAAFGRVGDLRNAVSTYDDYRDMAIANNAGLSNMERIDQDVYVALVRAYGTSGSLERGKKLLARIEADEAGNAAAVRSREIILTEGILPIELDKGDFETVHALVNNLSSTSYQRALTKIATTSADMGNVAESTKAFDALVEVEADLAPAASALVALHLRSGNIDDCERYFRFLDLSPATLETVQLAVLRSLACMEFGQTVRGLRSLRSILLRYRETVIAQSSAAQTAAERVEEAIEIVARAIVRTGPSIQTAEAAAEVLRMMGENHMFLAPVAENMVSGLSADHIANMHPSDLDIFTQYQARMILADGGRDAIGSARFTCMLESIVTRSIMPDVSTENAIEKALTIINQSELSRLWNTYRYPTPTAFSPSVGTPATSTFSAMSPPSTSTSRSGYDESFDPYLANTDHKGSVVITDILEKINGRPAAVLSEALTKFRNIRRAGRHPRFFAYSKLIQAASKANQLDTAREVLEMAKQDVPFLPQYRIVRHGWVAMLDSMVATCVSAGRRDLAEQYHQDLLDIGAAPSANTFGLYITSLKETTKTFDEASEAVKVFIRSKTEGVEPTSFLYNALIGKLGKARRIDDCLFYFAEMRNLGIRPTSVTYGTIVNALCRVSDEKFAEEMFEEMEACANYKPRPAPYHSLMQFFLTTKRDRSKVLSYYERMRERRIEPTMHTFKLLIDAHATVEPVDMIAAEDVIGQMKASGFQPEAVHYASLIHAKGCVLHDLEGARQMFDKVSSDRNIRPQPCVYQALFESLVANRKVGDADALLADMSRRRVEFTPYIANALIHGWTTEKNLVKAREAFDRVDVSNREPSTYEAMVRAHLAVEDHAGAEAVVAEALRRGYPSAVAAKIAELVAGGGGRA